MATERLYYADSWLCEFEGRVAEHGRWQDAPSVVLDRSAFYPESGGQLGDRGSLAGIPVVDVQVDADGRVHHLLDGALPAIGSAVEGVIDRRRRRVHMALHTGQHMLSRALLDVAGAQTVSSRLGASGCTLDVSRERVPDRELAAAVDLVNAVIDDDLEVRASFPSAEELSSIELRRDPKVSTDVRVVTIGDFDASPCGGTHCTRTGQVGVVFVSGVERYKGMSRIAFDAGPRARGTLLEHSAALRAIGHDFTCGPDGVADAIGKLRRELQDARGALKQLRIDAALRTADELCAQASGELVVAALPDAGPEVLRAVAKKITATPTRVCMLASAGGDGTHVVVARGVEATFDCGGFVKRAAEATGGRGGGRPERAEGKLPAGVDWPALVATLGAARD